MKIVLSGGLELLGGPDGCPHCPLSMVRQIQHILWNWLEKQLFGFRQILNISRIINSFYRYHIKVNSFLWKPQKTQMYILFPKHSLDLTANSAHYHQQYPRYQMMFVDARKWKI